METPYLELADGLALLLLVVRIAALDLLDLGLDPGHLHHALLALGGDGQQSHLNADGEEDHGDAVVVGELVQLAHEPAEGDDDDVPKPKC